MIVITGGAGFIGSRLVEALVKRGERVVIFEDKPHAEHVHWRRGIAWLDEYASEITAVYHLGAITSTTEEDEKKLFDHNIFFTHRLWSWCADKGVPIVYASSAATYGKALFGFSDEHARIAGLEPLNAYARAKHLADRMILAKDEHGPRPRAWYGCKLFNVYGPGEARKGDMRSVIAKLYDAAIVGNPMELFDGSDEFFRDFVHIDDCIDVMLWLMAHKPASGIYNVGTGKAASFGHVAECVSRELYGAELRFIPMPENLRRQYQKHTEADITKLRAAGYDRPFRPIQDGVRDYVRSLAVPGWV